MPSNESFSYTYSAKEQEEIKRIRQKYTAERPPENPMTKLRRLDAAVTRKATKMSITIGIFGALLLGSGMSLFMSELGEMLGLQHVTAIVIGCALGVIGLCAAAVAYPVYDRLVKKERERIAPEILRLTDELMK